LLNRPEVAVGVIFATSVAILSLATGVVTFLHPMVKAPTKRAWAMVLPAAMLVFLAGFQGELTLFHAIILAVEGALALLLWKDSAPRPVELSSKKMEPLSTRQSRHPWLRALQFLLAVILASMGAWAAVRGVDRASHVSEVASVGLLSATLLSPLLVLPMLGTGVELANRDQSGIAISSQVGVVLLNLCALVPLIVGFSDLRLYLLSHAGHLAVVEYIFHVQGTPPTAVPFALAAWRVDVVAIIALGLFFLPVALGKWTWTKIEGLGLIVGYAAYLLLAMMIGVRV